MKLWEFFDKPEKWTKWAMARDAKGNQVAALSPKATCFCLSGALYLLNPQLTCSIDGLLFSQLKEEIRQKISVISPNSSLEKWNDSESLTFDQFHAVLKQADV